MNPSTGRALHLDLRARLQSALGSVYTIERELGGGGMSHVFVAREVLLDRRVVVKVLPPELAAGVSVERFRHEIQVAAKLQHPHIVPILAAGEVAGVPYYTMPLIEGESLRTRITRGGYASVLEVLRILHDVIDALAYAHSRGVVHRDIKPENVLLSGRHAMVTDFGVAKALSAAEGVGAGLPDAETGFAIGTPAYMAPEQAAADPSIDHRADLYAFGVVAYELLAGQPPFVGRAAYELLAAHVTRRPRPIAELRPDVPPALAAMVMRCLEKHPAGRHGNAVEIRDIIDALLTRRSTRAGASLLRRRETPAALAAAAAVLVVVGASLGITSSPPPTAAPDVAWVDPSIDFLPASDAAAPVAEATPPAPPSAPSVQPRDGAQPERAPRTGEAATRARSRSPAGAAAAGRLSSRATRPARVQDGRAAARARAVDATIEPGYGHSLRIALMTADSATVARFQRLSVNRDSVRAMADSLRRHVVVLAQRQRSASPAPEPPRPVRRSTMDEEMDWALEHLEHPEKQPTPEVERRSAFPTLWD